MRYFFHVHDIEDHRDLEGVEFATVDEARAEAVRATGELLKDRSREIWAGDVCKMAVKDENDITVCELMFSSL